MRDKRKGRIEMVVGVHEWICLGGHLNSNLEWDQASNHTYDQESFVGNQDYLFRSLLTTRLMVSCWLYSMQDYLLNTTILATGIASKSFWKPGLALVTSGT